MFEGIPIKSRTSELAINADQALLPSSIQSEITRTMPKFSLQHEFSLLNTNIPHLDIEVLDAVKRMAMIRISGISGHVIMLQIVFPENYPQDTIPEFIYCQGTSIDDNLAEKLNEVLKMNAQNRLRKGKTCLEHCLRALVTTLKKVNYDAIQLYIGIN